MNSAPKLCLIGTSVLALMLSACASVSSGDILKTSSTSEADVAVADSDVKAGDRVAVFKKECGTPAPTRRRHCWESKVGEGKVVAVNGESAKVKTDQPIAWTKGNFVRWSYDP